MRIDRARRNVPVKVRSDFVALARTNSMALGAARLEKLGTSLSVTLWPGCEDNVWECTYFTMLTGSVRHRCREA